MGRELKRNINSRLKSLNRQDDEQKYQTETKVNTVEEQRAKLDTVIGRDAETTSGIESVEVVQNSAGDVIQGEGVAVITDGAGITGQVDPKTKTLPYSTSNVVLNYTGADSGYDSAGFTVTAEKTGGETPQALSAILGSITGLPTPKLELPKSPLNLVASGSPAGISDALGKAKDLAGGKLGAVTSGLSGIADAGELTEIAGVVPSLNIPGIGGLGDKLGGAISGVPSLKTIDNPLDDLGNVKNLTGIESLSAKLKVKKLTLSGIPGMDKLDKVGDLTSGVDKLKGAAEGFTGDLTGKLDVGLGGVLQNVTEGITANTKNTVIGMADGNAFSGDKVKNITKSITEGTPSGDADAVKAVTANANISEEMKGVVEGVKTNTNPSDFKSEVGRIAQEQGIPKDDIDNATGVIDRADDEIKKLNPTIAGQMILDAEFYDPPKPIGEEVSKWSGRTSGDDVFTFVSSVEELNAEIQMISREISEVVIHATETATDKDIGSIEINNMQNKLGHDGIAYHYVIRRDGRLQRGRPVDRIGDHTSVNNHNNFSIGIVLVGGINVATGEVEPLANRSASSFTREQYTTLERFLSAFYSRYPGGNVFGHNDLDVDEIDPYFDVQDYVQKVFRKVTNQITDPLSQSPVEPNSPFVNR